MNAKTYLSGYSERLSRFRKVFFKFKIAEAERIDSEGSKAIGLIESYMEGGKNARGALTLLGFKIAGGKDNEEILKASFAVELMHSSILIHDDFVDNDRFRRNKPTLHEVYKKRRKDEHYGASMAIIAADLGIFWAHQIFTELKFPLKRITRALFEFDRLMLNTGYGELMDIDFDRRKQIDWEDILRVRILKTAHYTFVMPLVIGMVLGGETSKGKFKNVEKYGEPVGLAFQIQDDILGVFGDSKETGKSVEGDIREGKKTLLYFKALELANKRDCDFIKKYYGKITNSDQIEKIRDIFRGSGSLEYSIKKCSEFAEEGKRYTRGMTDDKKLREILDTLADFVANREK